MLEEVREREQPLGRGDVLAGGAADAHLVEPVDVGGARDRDRFFDYAMPLMMDKAPDYAILR